MAVDHPPSGVPAWSSGRARATSSLLGPSVEELSCRASAGRGGVGTVGLVGASAEVWTLVVVVEVVVVVGSRLLVKVAGVEEEVREKSGGSGGLLERAVEGGGGRPEGVQRSTWVMPSSSSSFR